MPIIVNNQVDYDFFPIKWQNFKLYGEKTATDETESQKYFLMGFSFFWSLCYAAALACLLGLRCQFVCLGEIELEKFEFRGLDVMKLMRRRVE